MKFQFTCHFTTRALSIMYRTSHVARHLPHPFRLCVRVSVPLFRLKATLSRCLYMCHWCLVIYIFLPQVVGSGSSQCIVITPRHPARESIIAETRLPGTPPHPAGLQSNTQRTCHFIRHPSHVTYHESHFTGKLSSPTATGSSSIAQR